MESPELIEKKLSILQEITTAIVTTNNISTIANLILELAINYTNAEKGSVMLLNESGELYILTARGIDINLINSYRIKIGEGIAGFVAKTMTPIMVEDIDKDTRFKEKRDRYKTRAFISCPIISRDKLLGVLNINDKKDNMPFSEDEFDLIKIIANQAAIALENAFLVSELMSKTVELEEINKKLIDTDIAKTEFLTRISHELRTPLNSIKGAIYYLQTADSVERKKQKEFHEIINVETEKVINIIENLLDFLRIEDESRLLKKSIIDLSEIINSFLDSITLKNILARKNIHINIKKEEVAPKIIGDKIKVTQLFINLIEGLSKFLEPNDRIDMFFYEDNKNIIVRLQLSVALPDEIIYDILNLKNIFQLESSEDKLKLYLASKIVEIHGWKLLAENINNSFIATILIPKSEKQRVEVIQDRIFQLYVDFISELFNANICSVMLSEDITGDLIIKSARGLSEEIIRKTRIKFGDRIAGWVALSGESVLVTDINSDYRFAKESIPQYTSRSFISLPLKIKDRTVGVVNITNKKDAEVFALKDLMIASILTERVSHFIETLYTRACTDTEIKYYIDSFESMLKALQRYHKKNSLLPNMMLKLMEGLNVPEKDKAIALYVSMIYDLGLVPIYESVLKKENLVSSDIRMIKLHPHNTVNIINGFEFSDEVKKAILHHHEKYDGTGYPMGLKGKDIPFISRALFIIDSYCAMISEKPYKKTYTREEAIKEIKKKAGIWYDPDIVEAFERIVQVF